MSRPLKFRLWYGNTMYYNNYELWFDSHGDLQETYHMQPFEVMQWTGLVDAHGKEIFEGDILGYNNPGDRTRFVVEFCTNDPSDPHNPSRYAAFRLHMVKYEDLAHEVQDVDDYKEDDWWDEELIVVGNIYEHPELIQKSEKKGRKA